ncbi:MAG: LLM class flavin-dependent oxidoreductase [Chloroflexi bacterium]|nr:MAG: LLM class flavin-dependent oxidoreductase [Chloroflexota bacterium]
MVKVAVTMPAEIGDAAEFLADVRALEAAGADMVGLDGDGEEQRVLMGAIAAVTSRVKLRPTNPESEAILQRLSRGRIVVGLPADETWVSIAMPANRDAWAAVMREQEAAGVTGVVVAWDPRLIDLMRNPEPDDRSDLLMSTG